MKPHEVARLTGITVRTLQYYDKIGLLKPERVEDNGYRLYGEKSLARLQQILFLRELDFSLTDIAEILSSENYNANQALEKQKNLLCAKRDRLSGLIELIEKQLKGETEMSFREFDNSKIEKQKEEYAREAKERWGNTPQYAEYEEKAQAVNADAAQEGLNAIIAEFAAIRSQSPEGEAAQALVKKLQAYITANYYTCTKQILPSLAAMYVGDERFRSNMDAFGEGTAEFTASAITFYCR